MGETTKILLKQVPIFASTPAEFFEKLRKVVKERYLKTGEILFAEGEPGKVMYIIKSGKIDILKGDPISEKQMKLASRAAGDFFGEMSLLEDSPRFATARAAEDSIVLELSREDFKKLITENPSVALEVMEELSSRLRQSDLQMIHDLEKKNEQLEKTNKRLLETTEKLEKSYQSLKSTNKFLEKIISASQFFIIVTDSQGKIFIFNDAAKHVFGHDFSEIAGAVIASIIDPVGNDNLLVIIEDNLANGKTWRGDILTLTNNNKKLFIELVAARVFDEHGDIFATLYMGRDITEEKNVERQMIFLDRMATRGEMAAEIAHELNNYLAIVLGNLELMELELEMGKTDSAPKKIDSMKSGLEKITRFTDGLMMYSRPDMNKEAFHLHAFLENELFFIKPQNRFKGVDFVCDLDPAMPFIQADKSQVQQALMNLLNNAADAIAGNLKGQKKIIIRTRYAENEKSAIISIIDNGTGLKGGSIDRVFKQHFTSKERGHGFGLLAVKRVIKNHAGKVWAENNPEGGAIFNIQIPIKLEEAVSVVS
jgi:PAS domain S-box-containing protein